MSTNTTLSTNATTPIPDNHCAYYNALTDDQQETFQRVFADRVRGTTTAFSRIRIESEARDSLENQFQKFADVDVESCSITVFPVSQGTVTIGYLGVIHD